MLTSAAAGRRKRRELLESGMAAAGCEPSHMNDEFILAAVINWNGWPDTLACLDSMRAVMGPSFHLLICDNGSTDDFGFRFHTNAS